MLTPLDINNKEFKKGFRGYEMNEVDDFLDEVIKDFESLYKENLDLKDLLQKEKENIGRYKQMEETLQNTMVIAQKMAEDTKRNAEKEAELILEEAKKRADQIVSGAHQQVVEITEKQERLRTLEQQIIIRLKNNLKTNLELVEHFESEGRDLDMEETVEYQK